MRHFPPDAVTFPRKHATVGPLMHANKLQDIRVFPLRSATVIRVLSVSDADSFESYEELARGETKGIERNRTPGQKRQAQKRGDNGRSKGKRELLHMLKEEDTHTEKHHRKK